MTYIQVKVPDGTDISGYDAEYRIVKIGETIVTWTGTIVEFGGTNDGIGRIVLTPKWKPPEWLKPGFVFIAGNLEWYWSSESPVKNSDGQYWCRPISQVIRLSNTTFQGPDVEPKDSLIEITG